MDINKLSNNIKSSLSETNASSTSKSSSPASENTPADTVSIENKGLSKNEQRFAEIELEKLDQSSFERLKTLKKEVAAYEEAKKVSPEAARETKMGKKLNSPEVWSRIAEGIIGK